ncbi:general transcription factor IIH subunit 1-like protein [Leptotrombidium deliense]|uniref:General transcription factor IIH subunit 1-like protein n=1 Tax=Leptotrombidium deliense TaxID=299467 RepID=A0A443SGT9_9ACAR|nr:general transcription factor IIH subunit 1-like protein [Leptotrombidium deliense]
MILESSTNKERQADKHDKVNVTPTNGSLKHLNSHKEHNVCENDVDTANEASKVKKRRLAEKTQLDDLSEEYSGDCSSWAHQGTKPLKITNKDCYLVGPTPGMNNGYDGMVNNSYNSHCYTFDILKRQELIFSQWKPSLNACLTSQDAVSALSDLSPGGALLKSSHSIVLKDAVPLDLQKELKQMYCSCNELLHHFWACFPVTNEKLEEKVIQMKTTLERYQYSKLQPMHERLQKEQYNSELTSHILSQLQFAYNKFTNWQAKRNSLGRK